MTLQIVEIIINSSIGNTSGAIKLDSEGSTMTIVALGRGSTSAGGGGGGYVYYSVPNISGGTLSSFSGLTLYYTIGTILDNYDTTVRVGGITMIAYRATDSTGVGGTIIGGTGVIVSGLSGNGNTGGKGGGYNNGYPQYGNGVSTGSSEANNISNGAIIIKFYKDTPVTKSLKGPTISSTVLWVIVSIIGLIAIILVIVSIFVARRKK